MYCYVGSVLKCAWVVLVMPSSFGQQSFISQHSGVYTFEQLVTSGLFVDKSMMLEEFIESKCKINVITRPRKWGKTVNMDMFKRFFEVEVNDIGIQLKIMLRKNHILFRGGEFELPDNSTKILKPLKIANNTSVMKRLGISPVLLVKLASVKGKNFKSVEDKLKIELRNAFFRHLYLKEYLSKDNLMLNSTEKEQLARYFSNKKLSTEELEVGIFFLSKLLYRHYLRKIIVLVEDKDEPLNNAIESFGAKDAEIKNLISLLQTIFKSFTTNVYVKKCLVTGTVPFSEDSLFMNANGLCIRSVLDKDYSRHFGFTEKEVDYIVETALPNKTNIDKMKYWYKGFNYGDEMLYNPLDIMGYVSNQGKILDYWVDSGRVKALDDFLVTDEAQEDLQKLIEDEGTVKSLSRYDDPNDKEEGFHVFFAIFFRLLVNHGYLNAFKLETRNDYLLRIPNQAIRNLLVDYKTQWFCSKYGIIANDLHDFVGCLVTKQNDQLKSILSRIFGNFKKSSLENEKDYHYFMGEILSRLLNHNYVFSNKHFEIGKTYHMIIPRSKFQGQNAFVLEYVVRDEYTNSSLPMDRQLQGLAQQVLDTIESKVYGPILAQYEYINNIVTMAIAFSGRNLELTYKTFKQL